MNTWRGYSTFRYPRQRDDYFFLGLETDLGATFLVGTRSAGFCAALIRSTIA